MKKNKLIILAHPKKDSFSHWVAFEIKKEFPESFLIDLYSKEGGQDFLEFQDLKGDGPKDEKIKKIQEKILWSDEIIFIFPVGGSYLPAALKNFLDINFSSHFAFEYRDGRPVGLLKNKEVYIFSTADSPAFLTFFLKLSGKYILNFSIFNFSGMGVKKTFILSSFFKRSQEERGKYLKKIINALKK